MSEQPQYDEGEWPIMVVTLPKVELNDADLQRHVDRMSSFSTRGRAFVQVIDVRHSSSLSARARRIIAERMDRDEEAYPGILRGVAVVLATPLHRGIFKAISWLSQNPRPFEGFSELEEAKAWARRLLAAPLPSAGRLRTPGPP